MKDILKESDARRWTGTAVPGLILGALPSRIARGGAWALAAASAGLRRAAENFEVGQFA